MSQLAHIDGQELLHVVDDLSDAKSLCGRTCWPGKWIKGERAAGDHSPVPYCVTCIREIRK